MGSPVDSPPELSFGRDETPDSSVMDTDNNSTEAMAIMTIEDDNAGISQAMKEEEERAEAERETLDKKHGAKLKADMKKDLGNKSLMDKKFQRLDHLLSKSKVYSSLILQQMQQEEEQGTTTAADGAEEDVMEEKKRGRGRPKRATGQAKISTFFNKKDVEAKAVTEDDGVTLADGALQKSTVQPKLVTGGTLRHYQLEGLAWLKTLYENGLNGILADEMGLGKTIQTIAFLAFLREMQTFGPFLIVAPLSTLTNWVDEFNKWAPSIPVLLYHGSKPDRQNLQVHELKNPNSKNFPVIMTSYEIAMNDRNFFQRISWKFVIIDEGHRIKNMHCRLMKDLQSFDSANRLLITGTPLQNNLSELWSLLHFLMPDIFDDYAMFESWFDFSELKDRKSFQKIFSSEREAEIVTKLHDILMPFLLRRVKADVEKSLPKKREYVLFAPLTEEQMELSKAIMEGDPRKFLEQKQYEALMSHEPVTPARAGTKRKSAANSRGSTPNKIARSSGAATPASTTRGGRKIKSKLNTLADISDRQFFKHLDKYQPVETDSDEENDFETSTREFAKRLVAGKKLQNGMMQLRLCCNSPFNFYDPFIKANGEQLYADEDLVNSSGKMLLLDALLTELFKRDHKVLLFSQFKTQLDIIQTYAEMRDWNVCRIDGSVSQMDRAAQIKAFNASKSVSAPKRKSTGKSSGKKEDLRPANLFLLSTRAGGQGINLAAADTVILFDSDWNPQQDLQAQDRAHRIGQTRNVIVYRFATRGTVEQLLLEAAEGKRRLEKLVIQKGGVNIENKRSSRGTPSLTNGSNTPMSDITNGNQNGTSTIGASQLEELRKLLEQVDGEEFDIRVKGKSNKLALSKDDLKILMDRSDEAYERAEKGLDKGSAAGAFKAVEKTAAGGILSGMDGN